MCRVSYVASSGMYVCFLVSYDNMKNVSGISCDTVFIPAEKQHFSGFQNNALLKFEK